MQRPAVGSARTQVERTEHTRSALIAATIASLHESGYRATTTRQVAQRAGVSLGALAHHFPSRIDLITTTLDDVGHRCVAELHEQASAIDRDDPTRNATLLDVLWGYFSSELFTVWIKVWLAAADDPDLRAILAPINHRLDTAVATAIDELAPNRASARSWKRRIGVVLNALRGLALTEAVEPRSAATALRGGWPATRSELIRFLAD